MKRQAESTGEFGKFERLAKALVTVPKSEVGSGQPATAGELITDFSREPYKVLRAIPVTVRSLDTGEGFEAAFVEGNIAWVASGRVEAVNGLKAEILNTMEDFEANEERLGPEPARQLALILTYLKRTQ